MMDLGELPRNGREGKRNGRSVRSVGQGTKTFAANNLTERRSIAPTETVRKQRVVPCIWC